jgi:hypothetical protein
VDRPDGGFIIIRPTRYSKVCWLGPQDLEPYGFVETVRHDADSISHKLRIPAPFGKDTDMALVITADARTKVIAASILEGQR